MGQNKSLLTQFLLHLIDARLMWERERAKAALTLGRHNGVKAKAENGCPTPPDEKSKFNVLTLQCINLNKLIIHKWV